MFIPVSRPDISRLEKKYVRKAINSTWVSSSGEYIDKAEKQIAELSGKKFCTLTSNGTVAIHLALIAFGIGEGDEVIVPSFTFIASVNAITYSRATPVFVDINSDDWTINVDSIKLAVTPQTKAIMAVNIYGHPARLRELRLLANDLDLILIEDNAEAPFATCHGKPTGSFGHASTFSFFGNKVITSGEGGAVTTDDPEKNELMRTLRDHGMSRVQKYHFPYIGYNYRLNNLSAALLLAQIERKDETLRKRNELFLKYDAIFRNNDDFSIRPVSSWATSSPWLYSILAKNKELKEDLENRLRLNEIETRPLFRPIHLEPPYIGKSNCRISGELTVTSDISSRGLSLPTSSNFSRREIAHIMYVTKKSLQSIKA